MIKAGEMTGRFFIKKISQYTIGFIIGAYSIGFTNWDNLINDIMAGVL